MFLEIHLDLFRKCSLPFFKKVVTFCLDTVTLSADIPLSKEISDN